MYGCQRARKKVRVTFRESGSSMEENGRRPKEFAYTMHDRNPLQDPEYMVVSFL